MKEGDEVTYVGDAAGGLYPGDAGRLVVFASANAAHVQTHSGIYLVGTEDLVVSKRGANQFVSAVEGDLADSLDVGFSTVGSVAEAYADGGSDALLSSLSQLGALSALSEAAEEAVEFLSGRIRASASLRPILASLDDEAGDELVRMATAALIRDAFGEGEQ